MKPEQVLTLSCHLVAIVCLLGLAGCASGAKNWAKSGGTDAQRSADYAQCQSAVKGTTRRERNIDQDIAASRGGDWRNAGQYNYQQSQIGSSDEDYARRLMLSCMQGKGYRPL